MPLKIDIEKHFLFVLLPLRLGKENFWALIKKKKEFVLFRSLFPSSRSIPFIFSLDSFSQSWTDCLKAFRKLFYERIFVRSRRFPVETKIPISFHLSLSLRIIEWILRNETHLSLKKKTGEKFHGYLISFNQYLFIE